MAIEVKLQVFEGPLDLLLTLLSKNKVSTKWIFMISPLRKLRNSILIIYARCSPRI